MDLLRVYYTPLDTRRVDADGLTLTDDSLDNRVLVRSDLNGKKGDEYPISKTIKIEDKVRSHWEKLRKQGLITQKKYERLTRTEELTDDDLIGFIQRQLVETRQSTKAVATLLTELFPDTETEIVYEKLGLSLSSATTLNF